MAAKASRQAGPSAQFLGAHADTMQALEKLQLLVQVTPRLSLELRQKIADDTIRALWPLVSQHHQDEEQLLFPQMLKRANGQQERAIVESYIERLTREHREIEHVWGKIRPVLAKLSNGSDVELSADHCYALVQFYRTHTQFEETIVLPMAARLLTQGDQDAMSLSLALRHNVRNLTAYI
ncbi:MAG: hemerythrin domain-containing protein [Burkholderiaceae bacterium]